MKTIIWLCILVGIASASEILPAWELREIDAAIARNPAPAGGMAVSELRRVVIAIRKSENGDPGREFGILRKEARTYSAQAGWCVCTVWKNWDRWVAAGKPGAFVAFLGNRYCKVGAANDPGGLNANWVRNVSHWVNAQETFNTN